MKRVGAILLLCLIGFVCLADRRGQLMNQGNVIGCGPAFFPTNILAWYDAASNVFTSTGVLATNGQDVVEWDDISGNNYNITNLTFKPTYSTNVINGRPAVVFNPTSLLKYQNLPFGSLTGLSMVCVARIQTLAPPAGFRMLVCLGSAKHDIRFAGSSPYPSYVHVGAETTGNYDNRSFGYIITRYDDVLNYISIQQPNSISNSVPDTTAFEGTMDLTVGCRPNLQYPFSGELAELIIFPYVLSGIEGCSVVHYLREKYPDLLQ